MFSQKRGCIVPVSMLSLTMQSPLRSKLSLGNWERFGSLSSYTSPGTKSLEVTYFPNICVSNARTVATKGILILQNPLRSTRTSHSKRDISLSLRMVFGQVRLKFGKIGMTVQLTALVSKSVAAILPTDMIKIQAA